MATIVNLGNFGDEENFQSPKGFYEPVKTYRWDDDSAPALTGEIGTLNDLLDDVLVSGYGNKSGLGWSRISGSPSAGWGAWRNNTNGTGFCIRSYDPSAAADRAAIYGYEDMTTISTGLVNRFPSVALGVPWCYKSLTADSTERPWVIYGDSYCFYMLIYKDFTTTGTTNYAGVYFYGDFAKKDSDDDYNFGIVGCRYPKYNPRRYPYFPAPINWEEDYPYDEDGYDGMEWAARSRDGSNTGGIGLKIIQSSLVDAGVSGSDGIQANNWNGNLLYESFGGVSHASREFRGHLPGIYVPLHDHAFMIDDTIYGTLRYHKIRVDNAAADGYITGGILINTQESWREYF